MFSLNRRSHTAILAGLVLASILASSSTSAAPLLDSNQASADSEDRSKHSAATQLLVQQPQKYNNLDNLISEFLSDAGDRLKKNNNRMMIRPAKQALRFGKRSDPWPSLEPSVSFSGSQFLTNRDSDNSLDDLASIQFD